MSEQGTSAFQAVLETVDGLTLEEREMLLEIAYHRVVEQRRMHLAREVAEAREAYELGQVRRGTVDELMAELME